MDLETENRIAAILLKKAAELRRQAEQEGVEVYLRQPKMRGRPNSRFLTATVLGVQQANRAVEENEMWRARQKEIELDNRRRGRISDDNNGGRNHRGIMESGRTSKMQSDSEVDVGPQCSSRKKSNGDYFSAEDEGLRDDEVDAFLHSRNKRGRGSVGSRMDETGPYLPSGKDTMENQLVMNMTPRERQVKRVVLGPERPTSLAHSEYSEDESFLEKPKDAKKRGSSKKYSRKHKSKDKSRDKEKKKKKMLREEKRHKHCM